MILRLRLKKSDAAVSGTAQNVIEISRWFAARQARERVARGERQLVTSEEMARGFSALLWPASTVPMALAMWRMGQDLGFARDFFLQDGIGSKWQIWLGLSLSMMAAARHLAKWRAARHEAAPSTRPAALEVVAKPATVESVAGEQADGHPRWRFGNLR
jgi:hypothetical protein